MLIKMSEIRTRLAPSPTGSIHIGTLQKVLYSYAWAKKNGGKYVLRIEDTDRKRYVEGAEEEIYDVHRRLGIVIDESPEAGGPFSPYRQSERLPMYKLAAEKLVDEGHAYYAFETVEELQEWRTQMEQSGQRTPFRGKARDLSPAEQRSEAQGKQFVIRLKMPASEIVEFEDLIMGKISVNTDTLDDYVIFKSDGFPTYHLAVVVDDNAMKISHVFRGVEWLPTLPVHVLIYRYLGFDLPQIAHIPNILDPKGGKLSKRSGSVAALDFLKEGYLPEAIMNFMMLLGWSPKSDEEIFSLEEFVARFELSGFNKSNPVFNRDKLNWFNEKYIRAMSASELTKSLLKWAQEFHPARLDGIVSGLGMDKLEAAVGLEQERVVLLADLPEKLELFSSYLLEKGELPAHKQTDKLSSTQKRAILQAYIGKTSAGLNSHEEWEQAVREIAENLEFKAGQVFMLLRLAITGASASPPLFEFAQIIGQAEELRRLELVLSRLPQDEAPS